MGIVATRSSYELIAAIRELAEYLEEGVIPTAVNVGNSFYLVAEEWEKKNPKTPQEIHQFYRESKAFLWNLVLANYGIKSQLDLRPAVLKATPAGGTVLDVGAGIGSVLLSVSGWAKCVHADVGGVLMDYAAWRYKRMRVESNVSMLALDYDYIDKVDPRSIVAPEGQFNTVVCTEVVEHVPDPVSLLFWLSKRVRTGGKLICTVSFDNDHDLFPLHLNLDKFTNESFLELFPKFGLRPTGVRDLYEKVGP
jgi:2-polyprenyl-3-methyl-5-hydroxy-6-metoxy-1,4-benzoquinol methylase